MGTHPIFESDFDCLTDHPMINDYPENNCITCQNYLEKCSTEKLILAVNSKKEQPSLLCNTNNNLAQSNDVITQTTIDIFMQQITENPIYLLLIIIGAFLLGIILTSICCIWQNKKFRRRNEFKRLLSNRSDDAKPVTIYQSPPPTPISHFSPPPQPIIIQQPYELPRTYSMRSKRRSDTVVPFYDSSRFESVPETPHSARRISSGKFGRRLTDDFE